jgi:hypothetical protein
MLGSRRDLVPAFSLVAPVYPEAQSASCAQFASRSNFAGPALFPPPLPFVPLASGRRLCFCRCFFRRVSPAYPRRECESYTPLLPPLGIFKSLTGQGLPDRPPAQALLPVRQVIGHRVVAIRVFSLIETYGSPVRIKQLEEHINVSSRNDNTTSSSDTASGLHNQANFHWSEWLARGMALADLHGDRSGNVGRSANDHQALLPGRAGSGANNTYENHRAGCAFLHHPRGCDMGHEQD